MTSPQEAARLVGHSPAQEEADIVERLRGHLAMSMFASAGTLYAEMDTQRQAAADEIDRLRTALRAVRADPTCAAQVISDALRETKP
jgi:hypothetical protein